MCVILLLLGIYFILERRMKENEWVNGGGNFGVEWLAVECGYGRYALNAACK